MVTVIHPQIIRQYHSVRFLHNSDPLRDLVPFVQGCRLLACNLTKINTPPRVFLTFFKLYKWYQIAQRITYTK